MPIRPENKDRYPKNWPEISQRIRKRVGNKCEECRVENHALGGRLRDGTFVPAIPLGEKLTRIEWPEPGTLGWCSNGTRAEHLRIIRIVLTVAHLDHTPEHCADENLKAWCQRCHLRYDAAMKRRGVKQRARAKAVIGELPI